jgi:hypothetical protein
VNVASSDFKIGGSFAPIRIVWEEREKVVSTLTTIENHKTKLKKDQTGLTNQKNYARQRHGFMVDSATNMVVSTSCDNKWVTSMAIAMVRKNMRVIEKHQIWL